MEEKKILQEALETIKEKSKIQTDGKWLEYLVAKVAPLISEWDIKECWVWSEWPDRKNIFPDSPAQDIGIDIVGIRENDGGLVAIQCKSRKLNEHGEGKDIAKKELDSFLSASMAREWQEKWIVCNGNVGLGKNVRNIAGGVDSLTPINLASDVQSELGSRNEEKPSTVKTQYQSRQSMQDEAVSEVVSSLRKWEKTETAGPKGQARGKIILPCGTGKTRISLRIMQELTRSGDIAVVLCPSIALVAQIRREYLQHCIKDSLRILAVCSDSSAGYDPSKEGKRDATQNQAVDLSNTSTQIIKGPVTTNPGKIGKWLQEGVTIEGKVSVIIGTYQSGHRIAEALREIKRKVQIMICDEAHRTAGIHKKRKEEENEKLRNFTICHDQEKFPAVYRIYQTATPKTYGERVDIKENDRWIVRDMDDEDIFGVDLYRRWYSEAVTNGWLSDYRIIAVGINDMEAHDLANDLAMDPDNQGRDALTEHHYLRGLAFALAMSNAALADDGSGKQARIRSAIAFMNRVKHSAKMSEALTSKPVEKWLESWFAKHQEGRIPSKYDMEHLDAKDRVLARDGAKVRLANATYAFPRAILNVGIFGEGTDAPTLSAVAFLEPRKSPVDVVQAVGRAMRKSPNKELGYIICPIVIPPRVDPERWLQISTPGEGWQTLGQILRALRAHDSRIEDAISEIMEIYLPPRPNTPMATMVTAASHETKRVSHYVYVGSLDGAQQAAEDIAAGKKTRQETGLLPLNRVVRQTETNTLADRHRSEEITPENVTTYDIHTQITCKKNKDGSVEAREATPPRETRKRGERRSPIDVKKSKKQASKMVNEGEGRILPPVISAVKNTQKEKSSVDQTLWKTLEKEAAAGICLNLLTGSGLGHNRAERDRNILRGGVLEAGRYLRDAKLEGALNRHLGMENLAENNRNDSCNVTALMLLNAAMLHQRIVVGKWINVAPLSEIKDEPDIVKAIIRAWEGITRVDFEAVIVPPLEAIYAIEATGKTGGLGKALRHVAGVAEEIAISYAEMGSDHAGAIFNEFMGNQNSDGAFFTRPVASALAARLTLDATGDANWRDHIVWRKYKTLDMACGSGTLLTAMLTEMKRRAKEQGANEKELAELHKLGVQDTIKGLDINPISLQLAASQLTTSTANIKYARMGLHEMPYGPTKADASRVAAGTLELILQNEIVNRNEIGLGDENLRTQKIWVSDDAKTEDLVAELRDTRIVIMNPPFTNRTKMGEKFERPVQEKLRARIDALEYVLEQADTGVREVDHRNSIGPLFEVLSDQILKHSEGLATMVRPTIICTAKSGGTLHHL